MPHPAANSLRRTLLRRLAAPLSLLALMSGLIAYWLAWQYTQHVVDRSLADLATNYGQKTHIGESYLADKGPKEADIIEAFRKCQVFVIDKRKVDTDGPPDNDLARARSRG